MKKFFTSAIILLTGMSAFAQQDPQFTQYMHTKLFMNPGYAGIRRAYCLTSIYRNQWNGMDGAPNSGVISFDMPVDLLRGGVGVNLVYDKLGFESNISYNLNYSFHQQLGKGVLGVGIQAGGFSKRIGPTGSSQWFSTTTWTSDPNIPPSLRTTVSDFGLGLWYNTDNYWFGISTSHLNGKLMDAPNVSVGSPLVVHPVLFQVARHYFITGGVSLRRGDWEFKPSFLVKTDATITTFDLNATAVFNQRFWFGASYRYQDAICPMIGMMFTNSSMKSFDNSFKIGFAYDYNTSRLKSYNNGSFELFLNYCVPYTPRDGKFFNDRIFE